MIVLREYEDFCNTHRPHRALKQAAPLRQLPDGITDLDQFRIRRRDRAGGRFTNTAWWRRFSAPTGPAGCAAVRPVRRGPAGCARRLVRRPRAPGAVVMPQPAATRWRLVDQSRAVCGISGRSCSPGQTPITAHDDGNHPRRTMVPVVERTGVCDGSYRGGRASRAHKPGPRAGSVQRVATAPAEPDVILPSGGRGLRARCAGLGDHRC